MNQPNQYGEEATGSQTPTEQSNSLSALSSLDSLAEDLSERVETIKLEVHEMADMEMPALLEQEPVLTTKMTNILKNIYEGNKSNQELPKYSFEKILELIDRDIENCDLLIASLKEKIDSEVQLKKNIEQQRITVGKMLEDLDNLNVGPPRDISVQVRNMFRKLRKELRDLVCLWAGDSEEECTDILMSLVSAYLNEAGSNDQYFDVTQRNPKIIQMLVSNRIVTWNKEGTHIRLFM